MPTLIEDHPRTVELQADLLRPHMPQTLKDIDCLGELTAAVTAGSEIKALTPVDYQHRPEPTGFLRFPYILNDVDDLPVADPGITLPVFNIINAHVRQVRELSAQLASVTRTWESLLSAHMRSMLATIASPAPELVEGDHLLRPANESVGESECRSRAYGQFVELASWLGRTLEETADLLEIKRTTPFSWERDGHEPQPRRARRLYQTHALVEALVARLGSTETHRWLESGRPAPLSLIAKGRLDLAEDRAHSLIYGPVTAATEPINTLRAPDPAEVPLASTGQSIRRHRVAARSSRRTDT